MFCTTVGAHEREPKRKLEEAREGGWVGGMHEGYHMHTERSQEGKTHEKVRAKTAQRMLHCAPRPLPAHSPLTSLAVATVAGLKAGLDDRERLNDNSSHGPTGNA